MSDAAGTSDGWAALLTSRGRASWPFRRRVGGAFAVVIALHVAGLALLGLGVVDGTAGTISIGIATVAYVRGLAHAFDFDHVSMIDNSTRKFVSEGRDPASVGLAFSAGHSTVVVATSVLVLAGVSVVRGALVEGSATAQVLGLVGLTVSGVYLLLVAVSNLATFVHAWRLRAALRREPGLELSSDALTPRGPAARLMAAPLRRVRHPRHVYVVGLLFSLGFDTSSQIGLLVLTTGAALAGAPLISLLCLPLLFAAAMTLADTTNGLVMLKMYRVAEEDPARKITYNLVITGIGIVSGFVVATIAAATLLTDRAGLDVPFLTSIASLDTEHAGYVLAAALAVIGVVATLTWRSRRPAARTPG